MEKEIKIAENNDFKELIEGKYVYIDKTLLIKEIIDNGDKSIMIPRPRRFGKTLNLSMLYYYFSNEFDSHELFKGLEIMKQEEKYLNEMNKYPTIFLDLKNTKMDTFEAFKDKYKDIIKSVYDKHDYLLESDKLDETEKEDFRKIIRKEEDMFLADALSKLLGYLKEYYGKKVIVLLDEYDAPILHGYEKGYYNEIIEFMKQLFVTTFKPEPIFSNVHKGIITGMSRISKENLFSDANNIIVYNMTDSKFSTYFGFTEEEVIEVLDKYGLGENFDGVKKWYDGYLFNKTTIYNPWSILCYLRNTDHELVTYWANTGGVDLLKNLIYNIEDKTNLLSEFHSLLEKGYVEHVNIDLRMELKSLKSDEDTVWTLFMLSGYLTPTTLIGNGEDITLRIPNLEIKKNLIKMASSWFMVDYGGRNFIKLLANHSLEDFKSDFEDLVISSLSYYDLPNNSESEAFYHSFALGLLTANNKLYEITSNRESGYGRYDVLLTPKVKDIPAYVIEFKLVTDESNFEETLELGFKQIEDRKYFYNVKDYEVIKMVIAFKGKRLKIETR